jgi:hypothetical protein
MVLIETIKELYCIEHIVKSANVRKHNMKTTQNYCHWICCHDDDENIGVMIKQLMTIIMMIIMHAIGKPRWGNYHKSAVADDNYGWWWW